MPWGVEGICKGKMLLCDDTPGDALVQFISQELMSIEHRQMGGIPLAGGYS